MCIYIMYDYYYVDMELLWINTYKYKKKQGMTIQRTTSYTGAHQRYTVFTHPHIWISAWWLTYPSEKYEFASWGYYSQYMET